MFEMLLAGSSARGNLLVTRLGSPARMYDQSHLSIGSNAYRELPYTFPFDGYAYDGARSIIGMPSGEQFVSPVLIESHGTDQGCMLISAETGNIDTSEFRPSGVIPGNSSESGFSRQSAIGNSGVVVYPRNSVAVLFDTSGVEDYSTPISGKDGLQGVISSSDGSMVCAAYQQRTNTENVIEVYEVPEDPFQPWNIIYSRPESEVGNFVSVGTMSPDGELVSHQRDYSGTSGTLVVRKFGESIEGTITGIPSWSSIAFSPGSDKIAVAGTGFFALYEIDPDTAALSEITFQSQSHIGSPKDINFNESGDLIAFDFRNLSSLDNRVLRIMSAEDGSIILGQAIEGPIYQTFL